jgi:hypothetical protein
MASLFRVSFVLWLALGAGSAFSAKYAGDSFGLGVGARVPAMGGAAVAGPFDASAAYWNPAGLNLLKESAAIAMHGEIFGALLNHEFVAFVAAPDKEKTGLIRSYGFYLYYLGGGGIKLTDLDPQTGRPYVVRRESHGDFFLAGSIAGNFKSNIDYGLTGRFIYKDIPTQTAYGFSFDAGLLYRGLQDLNLGLAINNIASGVLFYSGGESETILPILKPGATYSRFLRDFAGRIAASCDIYFEDRKEASQISIGKASIDTHLGGEMEYKGIIMGRMGLDAGDITAGAGIVINGLTFDFNYSYDSELNDTYRFAAGFNF